MTKYESQYLFTIYISMYIRRQSKYLYKSIYLSIFPLSYLSIIIAIMNVFVNHIFYFLFSLTAVRPSVSFGCSVWQGWSSCSTRTRASGPFFGPLSSHSRSVLEFNAFLWGYSRSIDIIICTFFEVQFLCKNLIYLIYILCIGLIVSLF